MTTTDEQLEKTHVPVPKFAITRDLYGRFMISRAWLLNAFSEARSDHESLILSDEDRQVPPREWVFDPDRQTVTIGRFQMELQGEKQFKLLRFVCQGGTDAVLAWSEVWNFTPPVEYDTIRNTVRPLNRKLQEVGLPYTVNQSSKMLKISKIENQGEN